MHREIVRDCGRSCEDGGVPGRLQLGAAASLAPSRERFVGQWLSRAGLAYALRMGRVAYACGECRVVHVTYGYACDNVLSLDGLTGRA